MDKDEIIEELVVEIEGAANFMRGMQLDPALPTHVREALASKIRELDEVTSKHVD